MTTIPITATTNAKEFGRNLTEYVHTSSRGFSDALASQGEKFAHELFTQFRQIRPQKGSIFAAAASRDFRVRRKNSTTLVPTEYCF